MKKITSSLLVAVILCSGITYQARAATADINQNLKAEFSKDLPPSYSDAIHKVTKDPLTVETNTTASLQTESVANTPFVIAEHDEDQVRVVYTGHALLFAFLPVPVEIEVTVDTDGEARVALPWYRFLLRSEDTASVEQHLTAVVQSKTTLPAPSGVLSENDQSVILNILKENLIFHFTSETSLK